MQSQQNASEELPVIQQIINSIGEYGALALVEAFPGTTQRLPAIRNVASHHFVLVIGEVLLSGLVRDFGASRDIYIPRCLDGIRQKRNQAIVRDYLAGVPVNELALKYHLSDRQVWRILKETNMQDDRQESLF